MRSNHAAGSFTRIFALSCLCIPAAAGAQGGREFLQWLKEYSPTGYFIINDYETRANKAGDHKQWLDKDAASPLPGVAVHEVCHMRDGLNSKNNAESMYIGDRKDYSITPDFQPFNSKEMMPDIPASLENFQTDVYISNKANTDAYSQAGGLIGIMGEFDAYITELKSGVEMAACYKAHFNTAKAWDALGNDMTTSVWSNSEFRYFCLRYILWARKNHPAIYTKVTTGQQWRQGYTHLVHFAEAAMREWIAVLEERKMDTRTENGFDWYWKFYDEIQKQEYKDLEKLLLVTPVSVRPVLADARGTGLLRAARGSFDLLGRSVVLMPERKSPPALILGDARAAESK